MIYFALYECVRCACVSVRVRGGEPDVRAAGEDAGAELAVTEQCRACAGFPRPGSSPLPPLRTTSVLPLVSPRWPLPTWGSIERCLEFRRDLGLSPGSADDQLWEPGQMTLPADEDRDSAFPGLQ